jgi:hypothetical protein
LRRACGEQYGCLIVGPLVTQGLSFSREQEDILARKRTAWVLALQGAFFLIPLLAGPVDAASDSLLERYAALTTLSKEANQSPPQDRSIQACNAVEQQCHNDGDCCSGACVKNNAQDPSGTCGPFAHYENKAKKRQ